jgi:hypothetical protein
VNRFSSGPQPHYYGKGDVIAYRLNRDGRTTGDASPVFGANVLMLVHGASFWPTYTTGDNSALIATDSMKNFIQRETMNFAGYDLGFYTATTRLKAFRFRLMRFRIGAWAVRQRSFLTGPSVHMPESSETDLD